LPTAAAQPAAGGVTFSTFISSSDIVAATGQSSTIGITYAGNKFVGSLYFGTNNNQLFQSNLSGGGVTTFGAPIPLASGEVVLAASLGQGDFPTAYIYAGSQSGTQIYQFKNDGSDQTLFTTLPTGGNVRQIFFDPGNSFDGKMIVTTGGGDIYTVDHSGTATLLASLGQDTEGMDIAPSSWGPFAGQLLVASEGTGQLNFVSNMKVVTYSGISLPGAETVSFVPSNLGQSGNPVEGFYAANFAVDIQKVAPSEFAGLEDHVLVSNEFGGHELWDLSFDGTGLKFNGVIGTFPNQPEDGIFVTTQRINDINPPGNAVPEPSTLVTAMVEHAPQLADNPVAGANYWFDKTKGFQLLPSVYAEAELIKSKLSFRSQLSQRYSSSLNQNYLPEYYVDNIQRQRVSTLTTTESRGENYILDNLLTYKDSKGSHHWTLLLGQSVRDERFRSTQVITDSVASQQTFWYADLGIRRTDGYNETGFRNTSASWFGRLSYDFAGKYLLTATYRADGTSKYQDKWGYFPSVGIGWVLSEEDFMKDQHLFDQLKLRGSWGKLGNDNVNPSTGYAVVHSGNEFSGVFGSTGTTNGNLQTGYRIDPIFGTVIWEVVTEWDGGIDFSLLNKRLRGSVDYYHRQTDKLAYETGLPLTGIRQYGNWGKVNNSGIEVDLGWADKIGNLGYQVRGNLSTIKNEVVDLKGLKNLPGGVAEFPTLSQVGDPFNFFYGYQVVGIYQNQAEVDADPIAVANNVKPGYFKYKDQNGDKVLDADDRVNLGDYLPKITYGFNLDLNYKDFDFSIFFQGIGGK
jgi:hypothetical protein